MEPHVRTVLAAMLVTTSMAAWGDGVAKVGVCPKALEQEALDVASTPGDWEALHAVYKRFLTCDDGAIAEGFTETVVKILADHWASLEGLGKIAKKDPSFLRFVYRHITASAAPEDLQLIRDNLKKPGCPKSSGKVCREIELAVTQALEEM